MIGDDPYLDLSRLYALTVYLDHPVLAVDIEDTSVGQLSAHIAGMIETAVFVVREVVLLKNSCSLLGQIQIALCKVSDDADLAFLAVGDLYAVIV